MKEIKELLNITTQLRSKYEKDGRTFTLDGKLVGDIGEVLVKEKYDIELLPTSTPIHDAIENETGRKVQIKATFKGGTYFPVDKEKCPEFFLSVTINEEGELEEQYNGPTDFLIKNYIEAAPLKGHNGEYILSKGKLQKLNRLVPAEDKIGERTGNQSAKR